MQAGEELHVRSNPGEDCVAEMMEVEIEQAGSAVGWDTGLVQETMMPLTKANPQFEETVRMIIDDGDEGSHRSGDSGDTSFSEQTDRELFGCET